MIHGSVGCKSTDFTRSLVAENLRCATRIANGAQSHTNPNQANNRTSEKGKGAQKGSQPRYKGREGTTTDETLSKPSYMNRPWRTWKRTVTSNDIRG